MCSICPPVFSWRDGNAWDRGGLYKSCVIERDGTFYMFYNAKNVDLEDDGPVGWREQTGLATSTDMIHWTRFGETPVLPVAPGAWDSVFASDPWVAWDSREKQWVMFYYGFNGIQAMDGVAVSRDLRHWEKFPAPILTTGAGGYLDGKYAHKPAVAWLDGALYNCARRAASLRQDLMICGSEEPKALPVKKELPAVEYIFVPSPPWVMFMPST